MKVSFIIPIYNERNTVTLVIDAMNALKIEGVEKELVLVDDCSTDGTRDILATLKDKVATILYHEKNRGKGAAIRTAIAACTGDFIAIQDADLEYSPVDFHALLRPILQGKADVVFGSRFLSGSEHRVLYYWHSLGNQMLTLLSNIFSNLNLTDMEVCYKIFRTDLLKSITLKEDRFGFEPEVTQKIARLKCRIYEVGISYSGRTYEEGKKITWKDAVRAFWVILKYGLFNRSSN
jgi:glycosyltransferase involved in cell wall biosynthesis